MNQPDQPGPVPEPELSEDDIRTIEAMRETLLDREEHRYMHPFAASLIAEEIPLLIAEIRRLRG